MVHTSPKEVTRKKKTRNARNSEFSLKEQPRKSQEASYQSLGLEEEYVIKINGLRKKKGNKEFQKN